MEAEIARPQVSGGFHLGRGVGRETSGVFVKDKLVNLVGARVGCMGYKGEPVGRVGLYAMGCGRGHYRFDGWMDGSAVFDAVDLGRSPVVGSR